MPNLRYIVRVLSLTTGQWRMVYESSLRQAIALTYGLETAWKIVDTRDDERAIASSYCVQIKQSSRFLHNLRAFRCEIRKAEKVSKFSGLALDK